MKRILFVVAVSFSSILWLHVSAQSANDGVPLPQAQAVLGDSISEGMLVQFSIERPPLFRQIAGMMMVALYSKSQKDKLKTFREKYVRKESAWATGGDVSDLVFSHFERLKEIIPDFKGFNFAISGETSHDLARQVRTLLKKEEELGYTIDYLTIFIGANDLQGEELKDLTSPFVFLKNVENSLRMILDKDEDRRILLVGLPSVFEIFEETKDTIAYTLLNEEFKCSKIRKLLYGNNLLFRTEDKDYFRVRALVRQYDRGVDYLVARLSDEYPLSDLKFVYNYLTLAQFKKALSIDCFHPSRWGQAQIAEVTWELGFWPDLLEDDEFDLE